MCCCVGMPGMLFQCKLCLILDTFRSSITSFSPPCSHCMLQNFTHFDYYSCDLRFTRNAVRVVWRFSGVGVLLFPEKHYNVPTKPYQRRSVVWSFKLAGCVYLASVWPACNRGSPGGQIQRSSDGRSPRVPSEPPVGCWLHPWGLIGSVAGLLPLIITDGRQRCKPASLGHSRSCPL